MVIKDRKPYFPLIIAFVTLFVVLSLSINRSWIKEEVFTVFDKLMAQDYGVASLSGLLGDTSYSEDAKTGFVNNAASVIFRMPQIISSKIMGFPERPDLDRMDIDIKFSEYQKILEDRKKALDNMILNDPSEVKARIRYNGHTYKADIRLKGDLYDHWRSKVSMSLRVSLKGKKVVKGFKRFSLHKPGSRQYPYDQVFQAIVRDSGGLATPHEYMRIFVNGENWGIMHLEEHMSKEFLEKQKAKESIIFKFGDELKWYYDKIAPEPYGNYRISDKYLFPSVYQEDKYVTLPLYRQYYSYVTNKFLDRKEMDVLDIDSYSRAALAAIVWNNFHTISSGNTRHYFNPYTLRIEPITTDQAIFAEIKEQDNPFQDMYEQEATWIFRDVLFSDEGQRNLLKNFDAILPSIRKTPEFYNFYKSFFPNNAGVDMSVVASNAEKVKNLLQQEISYEKKSAIAGDSVTKTIVPTEEQSRTFFEHVKVIHYDDGRLVLYNLLGVPVKLVGVLYKERPLAIEYEGEDIPPSTENNGKLVIRTEKTGIQDNLFTIVTSYGGYERKTNNNYTLYSDVVNPLVSLPLQKLPDFIVTKEKSFNIPQGNWRVEKPFAVSGDLTIDQGTHITFSPDAYMIVKGNLVVEGTVDEPVIFQSQEGAHWKGIYVTEGNGKSVLRNVVIKNTTALSDGMLMLTGGVTFYKSPVDIENVSFNGTIAEDALNIVKSEFLIKNSIVSDTVSDGFDSDFSEGKIMTSTFERIDGDAVDFSGSRVLIEGVTARNIRDKAVSVGEKSDVTVKDSFLEYVGVGVAAKDGSAALAERVTVRNHVLFAAMAYIKKDMFGEPELKVIDMDYEGDFPFLSQNGTRLYVDNKLVAVKDVDVEKLYEGEVMRK